MCVALPPTHVGGCTLYVGRSTMDDGLLKIIDFDGMVELDETGVYNGPLIFSEAYRDLSYSDTTRSTDVYAFSKCLLQILYCKFDLTFEDLDKLTYETAQTKLNGLDKYIRDIRPDTIVETLKKLGTKVIDNDIHKLMVDCMGPLELRPTAQKIVDRLERIVKSYQGGESASDQGGASASEQGGAPGPQSKLTPIVEEGVPPSHE